MTYYTFIEFDGGQMIRHNMIEDEALEFCRFTFIEHGRNRREDYRQQYGMYPDDDAENCPSELFIVRCLQFLEMENIEIVETDERLPSLLILDEHAGTWIEGALDDWENPHPN